MWESAIKIANSTIEILKLLKILQFGLKSIENFTNSSSQIPNSLSLDQNEIFQTIYHNLSLILPG